MKTKTKLSKKTAAGKVASVKTNAVAPPKKHTARTVRRASRGTVMGHSRTVEGVLNAADEQSRDDALHALYGMCDLLAASGARPALRKVMAELSALFRCFPCSARAAKAADRIAA